MAQFLISSSHQEDNDDLKYEDENNEEIIILIPTMIVMNVKMGQNYVWTGAKSVA